MGAEQPINSISRVVALLSTVQRHDVKPQLYPKIDPVLKYLKNVEEALLKINDGQAYQKQARMLGELIDVVSFHNYVSVDVKNYCSKYIQKQKMDPSAKFWTKARYVIKSAMEKATRLEGANIHLKKIQKQLEDKKKSQTQLEQKIEYLQNEKTKLEPNKRAEVLQVQIKSNQSPIKRQGQAPKPQQFTARGETRLLQQVQNQGYSPATEPRPLPNISPPQKIYGRNIIISKPMEQNPELRKLEQAKQESLREIKQQFQRTYQLEISKNRSLLLNEIENAGKLAWVQFIEKFDTKDKHAMEQNIHNLTNKQFAEVVIRKVLLSTQKSLSLLSNSVCQALSMNRNQLVVIEQLTENSLKQEQKNIKLTNQLNELKQKISCLKMERLDSESSKNTHKYQQYCHKLETAIRQMQATLEKLSKIRDYYAEQFELEKDKRKAQQDKYNRLQSKLKEQKTKWKQSQAKYKEDIKQKQSVIEMLKSTNTNVTDYHKKTEQQNKVILAQVTQLQHQVTQLQIKLIEQFNESQTNKSEMNDYKIAYILLKDEVDSCFGKAEEILADKKKINTLTEMYQRMENALSYQFQTRQQYRKQLQKLQKQQQNIKTNPTAVTSDIVQTSALISSNFIVDQNLRQNEELRRKLMTYQDQLKQKRQIEERENQQLSKTKASLANLKIQKTELQANKNGFQKYKDYVEAELDEKRKQIERMQQINQSLCKKLKEKILTQTKQFQPNQEKFDKIRDLMNSMQGLTKVNRQLEQKISNRQEELAEIKKSVLKNRQELERINNDINAAKTKRNQMDKQVMTKQKQLVEKENKFKQQLKKVEEELEKKNKEKQLIGGMIAQMEQTKKQEQKLKWKVQQERASLNILEQSYYQIQGKVADANRELSLLSEIRREYADIKSKLEKANSDYKQKQRQLIQIKQSLRQCSHNEQRERTKTDEIVRKISNEAKEEEKKLQKIREEYSYAQNALTRIENDLVNRRKQGDKMSISNSIQRGFPFPQMIIPADTDFIISQVLKLNPHCTIKQANLLFKYPLMGNMATQAYRHIGERPNFIVVVKLKSGRVIAMYSQISLEQKRLLNHGISFIASVTNRRVFYFREDCEVEHSVAVCFGSRLIFGNGELLLYMGHPSHIEVDINPHMYSFETAGQTAEVFVGEKVNRPKHEVDEYEIIQVEFEEKKMNPEQ